MIPAVTRAFKRLLDPKLLGQLVLVGAMTVGVKAVAFLKELVVAHRFGTSDEVDAFLVAVMVPTMIAFIVGDAFRDAVVPAYTKLRINEDPEAPRLMANVLWICAVVVAVLTVVTLLLRAPLVELLTSNFSSEKQGRSEWFLILLFPFAICFACGSVLKGFLQANQRFGVSSVAAAAVPAFTILVLLLTPGPVSGVHLAISAGLGTIVMIAILVWNSTRVVDQRLLGRPSWDGPTRCVIRRTFPLLAGGAILEGCYFVDTMMATALPPGSVATLTYGERICTIVLAIGGTAAGQVLFPHVSELVAKESWKQLWKVVLRFSSLIVILTLPFVVLFWFAAEPIVRLLLERGEFVPEDTERVAAVLRFASFQIPGYILAVLGSRVVVALGSNRFLLSTTVFTLALNIVLNLLFIQWFGLKGIALSTAVVTFSSAVLLYIYSAIQIKRRRAGSSQ